MVVEMIFKTKELQNIYNLCMDIQDSKNILEGESITGILISGTKIHVTNASNLTIDQQLMLVKELTSIQNKLWERIDKKLWKNKQREGE